jgi:hypothetical protein
LPHEETTVPSLGRIGTGDSLGEADMWGNVLRSALMCGVLATGIPAMADGIDPYTPVTPRESSLAGSDVSAMCERGDPVIAYSLVVTDESSNAGTAPAAPTAATLTMTDGAATVELPLGTVSDGRLDGTIAWPADEWTRAGVEAEVSVGELRLAAPLEFPTPTRGCAASVTASALAGTGAEVPLIAAALGGTALLAGGIAYGVGRRRTRRAAAGR